MPELPEVQTTVNGLKERIIGLTIRDVWSGYNSPYFKGSKTIKDPTYFKHFKREILGKKVISIERRAKNILINLERVRTDLVGTGKKSTGIPFNAESTSIGAKTILVHMKMTGHLLYGDYEFMPGNHKDPWNPVKPESLKDPKNRLIRFVITFNNGKQLSLSDMRKFAKVTLINTDGIYKSKHLENLGPEPLDKDFNFDKFNTRLDMRPKGKIKLVLMDQTVVSGIGNIYADESLWYANIHPAEKVRDINTSKRKILFNVIRKLLARGINLGGDSMSDYRNVSGEKGRFQEQHRAYRKTGMKCSKRGCKGIIQRMVVGGRGTHYCGKHQRILP